MTKRSRKVLADKARDTHHRKTDAKAVAKKAGRNHPKKAPKIAAQKASHTHRKIAPKVAIEKPRGTPHKTTLQPEGYRVAEVPDSMRALAEKSVAQTRQLYERSKDAFDAILESWEKSFGGTVALNRKIIDIAERNITSSFDLAAKLAGAKSAAEAVELQTAYWRKQLGNLNVQAGEVRALAAKALWQNLSAHS
jgi:hypothetical protein